MLAALEPLMLASGDGLAVIIVSHQRKSGGEHGEAVRGSNALTGTVDVILEIERVADVANARALIGTSRFSATPPEPAVELGEDGYTEQGDVEALRERLDADRVLTALGTEWATAEEIAEEIDMPPSTVRKRLGALHGQGRIDRDGEGKRGRPFRFRILSARADPLVRKETEQLQLDLDEQLPEHASAAEEDADVLELLGQAQAAGVDLRVMPDDHGPLDASAWMARHVEPELAAFHLCAGEFADGRKCTSRRKAGSRWCGRHEPEETT
jgi:predicted transcriptional regulator